MLLVRKQVRKRIKKKKPVKEIRVVCVGGNGKFKIVI